MRSAFVTGAYGLLGTAIVHALLDRGVDVAVLRRDVRPRSPLVLLGLEERVSVVAGDVADLALMDRTIGEYEIDTVFHLAAQTIVGDREERADGHVGGQRAGAYVPPRGRRASTSRGRSWPASTKPTASSSEAAVHGGLGSGGRASPTTSRRLHRPHRDAPTSYSYGLARRDDAVRELLGPGDLNFSRIVPEAVDSVIGHRPVIRTDGSLIAISSTSTTARRLT